MFASRGGNCDAMRLLLSKANVNQQRSVRYILHHDLVVHRVVHFHYFEYYIIEWSYCLHDCHCKR